MKPRAPYHECPECGSAAVTAPKPGTRAKLVCRRCGHKAWRFERQAFDPDRHDSRPRIGLVGGGVQVLPTCREASE